MSQSPVTTITVTEFGGPLTRRSDGDIKSGLAKYDTSWGYNPYAKPGNLTWMENPTSILTLSGAPISAMKQRTEGTINYVYGVQSPGTLYKIQVSSTLSADVDSPSVIGAVANATYVRGTGLVFFGASEKIFVGADERILKANFDGSGASVVGEKVPDTPTPMTTFLGKVYFGNGTNIGEIDSTELITRSSVLSPALPSGLFVRDLEVTPDGNYLQITASGTNAPSPLGGTADRTSSAGADSYKFLWNGIDNGVTSFKTYPGLVLSANEIYADKNNTFGYDSNGPAVFGESGAKVSLPNTLAPHVNATFSVGDTLGFAVPEYTESTGRISASIFRYGTLDEEVPHGLYRLLKYPAQVKDDVLTCAACDNVSNLLRIPQIYAVTGNTVGIGKIYLSTREGTSSAPNTQTGLLWRFHTTPMGRGSVVAGVYETQTQLFSKKVQVKEARLYTEPLVADNSFTVELIGSGGSVISGSGKVFTVGSNVTAGQDMVHYNPDMAPTYAVGVRITNNSVLGTKNWTATKLELDVVPGGK